MNEVFKHGRLKPQELRERVAMLLNAHGYQRDSDCIPAIKVHEMMVSMNGALNNENDHLRDLLHDAMDVNPKPIIMFAPRPEGE